MRPCLISVLTNFQRFLDKNSRMWVEWMLSLLMRLGFLQNDFQFSTKSISLSGHHLDSSSQNLTFHLNVLCFPHFMFRSRAPQNLRTNTELVLWWTTPAVGDLRCYKTQSHIHDYMAYTHTYIFLVLIESAFPIVFHVYRWLHISFSPPLSILLFLSRLYSSLTSHL